MHRNTDYTSFYDGGTYPTQPGAWNPSNGIGYWQWNDYFRNSSAWIYLPNVHGLLVIGKLGHGNGWYERSTLDPESGSATWFVYNPQDLAAVAMGQGQSTIQPVNEWISPNLPLCVTDVNGWGGEGLCN